MPLGPRPARLDRRLDEAREQRMGVDRPALELGMELAAQEPGVAGELHDFGQLAVRAPAADGQPALRQPRQLDLE